MANSKSAQKSHEQSLRKRVFNERRKRNMKRSVKEIAKTVETNDKATAVAALPKAYQAIDKAAKRGLIKKNTASRRKAVLAKRVAALS